MRVHVLILGLAGFMLFACDVFSPFPPPFDSRNCTAVGCGPTLQIEFSGTAPADFVLTVTYSSGEKASVHCINGTTLYDNQAVSVKSAVCVQNGVSFLNFTPQPATITIQWTGGEISQSLQPDYKTFRPNGPQCEPECRTAQIVFDLLAGWKTYTDAAHGFAFKYPPDLEIIPGGNDTSFYIGKQISFYISNKDPLDCQGGCSVIESVEPVTVAGLQARRVWGHTWSEGDDSRYYQALLFQRNELSYNFILYASNTNAAEHNPDSIWPLEETDLELFNQMMGTFKFMN